MKLLGVAVAAVRLHGDVARLEPCFSGEELRGVGFRAARAAVIEQPRRLQADELRRLELRPRHGERMRDRLVLPDRPVEDHALLRVLHGALERGTADADGLDGRHDALGIERVEQVVEALPHFADHIARGNLQPIDEDLVRVDGGATELLDLAHGDLRPIERREEEREAAEGLGWVARRRAREQEHVRGLARVGVPHLAPVDDETIALLLGERLDARGVGARVRLGDAERHHDIARRDLRQIPALERLAAVLDDRHRREHVEVHGRRAARSRPRRADLAQHEGGLGDAEPGPAVLLGDDHPEPAAGRERLHELPRVLVLPVLLEPVVRRERARQRSDFLLDELLLLGQREVHRRLP